MGERLFSLVGYFFNKAFADDNALHNTLDQLSGNTGEPLDILINQYSLQAVYIAAICLGFLLFVAVIMRNPSETAKRILFWSITGIIALATASLIGMTVYLNQISVTKGPVHWHADFQIWACGVQQDLKDPEGISNKIGTPTLHEHDDDRIHVEGVVVDYTDVSFGEFFRVIGGELTKRSLTIPTNEGAKNFISGQSCPDNDLPAQLQVFAITANLQEKTFTQTKLTDPANYQFTRNSRVPPGDCLIVEFETPKDRTNKLCQSYEVAKVTGELLGEHQEGEDGH